MRIGRVLSVFVILVLLVPITVFATSPNTGWSRHYLEAFYDGHVQCQPSYLEDGAHAARAYLRFQNGVPSDTGRIYTEWGTGPNDTRILKRDYLGYMDVPDWDAPEVEFNYGFDWAPVGIWPFSIEE